MSFPLGGRPQLCLGAHFPTAEKPLTSRGGHTVLRAALLSGSLSLFFQGEARSGFPALNKSPPPTLGKRELGSHPSPGLRAEPVDGACRHQKQHRQPARQSGLGKEQGLGGGAGATERVGGGTCGGGLRLSLGQKCSFSSLPAIHLYLLHLHQGSGPASWLL